MNSSKAEQRLLAYSARNAQLDKDNLSRQICQTVLNIPAYKNASTVMWYLHCRSEVKTLQTVTIELKTDRKIVVPYCTKDAQGQNKLGLWWLEDLSELVSGTWGILEAPSSRWGEIGKEINPTQLDFIVVPGVAFDRQGGRLGNGAGYYDRLLHQVRKDAVLAGVCYESQLLEQVHTTEHDVLMNFVVTEQTIYSGYRGVL
jgi:5-formyltetrahydrofolate cyclo-ligase